MDRGRSEVYAAELAAFDGTDLEVVRPIETISDVIAAVVGDHWWPGPTVHVVAARADASSSCARPRGSEVEVRLAAPQATWATAAHELAHALVGVQAGHDERYRRAMLDVVEVLTNRAISPRRGSLHVDQLTAAYAAAGLAVGDRSWPAPAAGGPIAL